MLLTNSSEVTGAHEPSALHTRLWQSLGWRQAPQTLFEQVGLVRSVQSALTRQPTQLPEAPQRGVPGWPLRQAVSSVLCDGSQGRQDRDWASQMGAALFVQSATVWQAAAGPLPLLVQLASASAKTVITAHGQRRFGVAAAAAPPTSK
jgi:hypothetical protein